MTNKSKIIRLLLIIIGITSFSFLPSIGNGFVNWDDDVYIINNNLIKELSWNNIGKIFDSPIQGVYKPVTYIALTLEYYFFKLNPFFYHLVNLIFHLANSLLVFWFIFLITKRTGVSFITALLFGIHPLHVESVAWAFQLKDMLYGFFFLWALIFYLYFHKSKLWKYYYLSLISYALSLLSKPMGIILPFVLLCIDYIERRRLTFRSYLDKIPFVFMSIGIVMMSFTLNQLHVTRNWNSLKLFLLIPYRIAFYLGKTFFPVKLSCFYPDITKLEVFKFPFSIIFPLLLLFLTAAVIFSKKYTKKIIFGSSFFLLLLFPVLVSLINEAVYGVADHFMYLALIGILYILAEGFFYLYRKKTAFSLITKICLILLSLLITSILSNLTYQRCKIWEDGITLWSDVIKNYPDVATAYLNRSSAFLNEKEYDRALPDLLKTISLEPNALKPHISLCALYIGKGEYLHTIELCNNIINSVPDSRLYLNLGIAYNGLGKTQEAHAALIKALSLGPINNLNSDIYCAMAEIYLKENNTEKTIDCCEQALAKNPYNAKAYNCLIAVQIKENNHQEIIKLCKKIIELNLASSQTYYDLGSAYAALGNYDDSIRYSLQALELNPNFALTHANLSIAYYYTKQYDLAIEHCDKAIQLQGQVNPSLLKQIEALRKKKTVN